MRQVRTVFLALTGILIVVIGLAYFVVRTNGLAADQAPGRVETAIARRLVLLSIPAATRRMANPNAADADAWRAGADHFADHCAVCHGSDGRGHSTFGPHMYPPVPDLTSAAVQDMSDGALFAVVQNGVRWTGMPAFRAEHDADDIWKMVSFIRRLPRVPAEDTDRQRSHSAPDHDSAHQDAGGTSPHTISMDATSFEPRELTVNVGETVAWVNQDPFPHNISSVAGGFSSGNLDPDEQWRFRATMPGRFRYVCTVHPGMTGTLIVTSPGTTEAER